jgi:hypothetical protein
MSFSELADAILFQRVDQVKHQLALCKENSVNIHQLTRPVLLKDGNVKMGGFSLLHEALYLAIAFDPNPAGEIIVNLLLDAGLDPDLVPRPTVGDLKPKNNDDEDASSDSAATVAYFESENHTIDAESVFRWVSGWQHVTPRHLAKFASESSGIKFSRLINEK